MKKYLFIAGILLSLGAFSQHAIGITTGVGSGFKIQEATIDNVFGGLLDSRADLQTKIGLAYRYQLGSKWYINSGLNIQTKGYTEIVDLQKFFIPDYLTIYYCFIEDVINEGNASIQHNYSFVQLPLQFEYALPKSCEECGWGFSFAVGPTFNYLLSHHSNSTLNYGHQDIEVNCAEQKKFIVGSLISIGLSNTYDEKHTVRFNLFYDQNLQAVYNDPYQQYFYTIGFGMDYLFGL